MFQGKKTQDQEPPGKVKGKKRSMKTLIRFVTSHLGLSRGGRVGKEEPPPPATPGTHTRVVSPLDGSIEWVKTCLKVISRRGSD